jgi:acyl carrier protein
MTVSSRTPEGEPGYCVLCGKSFYVEFSDPGNDATCPYCGQLVAESADLVNRLQAMFVETRDITPLQGESLRNFLTSKFDSLEAVELVMRLEKNFGIRISEDDAITIQTVKDAVYYILKHQKRPGE